MATLELGTFLAMLAVPVVTLIFMGKIRSWGFTGFILFLGVGALSFIMFGGLTLAMASEYDVVLSTTHAAHTDNAVARSGNGTIVTNTTSTTPETTDSTPIINAYHAMWSYVFLGCMLVFGLLFFWVMIFGGTG